MSSQDQRQTRTVGIVRYPDKLRPRDELVRLAWLAHDGRLFASGAMSLAAQLGANVDRGAVVAKVVRFEWRCGRYRARKD